MRCDDSEEVVAPLLDELPSDIVVISTSCGWESLVDEVDTMLVVAMDKWDEEDAYVVACCRICGG